MSDETLTQVGLAAVYCAVGVLIRLTERVERSQALRIWSWTFFLFAVDALVSAIRMVFHLSPEVYIIAWLALAGAGIAGVAGTVTFIGKPMPKALFVLGGVALVATILGLLLHVETKVIQVIVFVYISIAFSWAAKLTFDVGIPNCIGRWVIGSAFAGAGVYALVWPALSQFPGFPRFEFFVDFSLVMWGAAGALLVHFERSRQRIEKMVAKELELRDHLERSERMEALGRLAGGVAHDFNNVLMTVIHGSELALRQLADRPQTAEHVESILEAARGAARFTRQLLALGRRRLPGRKPIGFHEAIRNGLSMVRPILSSRHILVGPPEDDSIGVLAGEGQIEQVIFNLSLNALDAMPEGGTLTLEVATEGDRIRLLVRDTGCGMDEDTSKRVFEPFFSTKGGKIGKGGSGLGLAAVYAIVQQLEGHIAVASTIGSGTCFTVDLPSCEPPPPIELHPIHSLRAPSTVRILLVDDQASILRSLSAGLALCGFEVTPAASAEEAIRCFEANPPTLLLTDLSMPGMSGLELVAYVRKTDPKLPVIIMTGHANDEAVESSRHVAQWLLKPFTTLTLRHAIDSALSA